MPPITIGPRLSTISQSQPIKRPPSTAPQLLPDPPTITITQIRKVKRRGLYSPGVSWPAMLVYIAPAIPTTAEPRMKTCRCRRVTSLPMAAADTSLSRMARIMRPHGLFSARSDSQITASSTARKSAA